VERGKETGEEGPLELRSKCPGVPTENRTQRIKRKKTTTKGRRDAGYMGKSSISFGKKGGLPEKKKVRGGIWTNA